MPENKTQFILFTLEFPPQKGGVSKYYENLAKHWPENNLLVLSDGKQSVRENEKIIRRQLINNLIRPRWLPSLFHLYNTILKLAAAKKIQPGDFHIIAGQILPLGLPTFWLSKILKFKYSIVLHGLDFSLALNKPKQTKKILSEAEKIICANGYTASLVRAFNHSLSKKIQVVNPGINPNFVRNPAKIKELREKYSLAGKKILFGLGRLVKRKGFDKAIAAMEFISAAEKQAVLIIAGSGPEEEKLKEETKKLPEDVSKKIFFTGRINNEEYWAWLELCDIFIMVSRNISGDYEGFGIVYLEANLAGKPVLAGDSGGVRDAVLDNVNGLLTNPEDEKNIAEIAIKLLSNERLRQELGSAGNRRVVESLSAKKQAEKFYKFLLN